MNRKMTVMLSGISFLAMSCTKSDSSNQISFDSQDTGILYGTQVTSSDIAAKSVVKVISSGNPKDPLQGALCAGTLVEKQFVVTAAHCLITADGTPYPKITVFFPYSKTANSNGPTEVQGKTFLTHPLYQKVDHLSYDVSLILLESEAPSDSVPATIPLSFPDLRSLTLYDAGFGATEKGKNLTENLNWTPVSLLSDSEIEFIKANKEEQLLEVNSKEARTFIVKHPVANLPGVCHGDSGGPLFYLQNSTMLLLGVNSSTSGQNCSGRANVSSIPYLRRFFSDAFHQLLKLGKLEGKAHIPAWEDRDSLVTDSQNIEIWRTPTKLPLALKLVNESYSFKKARLISPKSLQQRMFSGDGFELQFSTDDKFNCSSKSREGTSSPTIAIFLLDWPRLEMIEPQSYFLVYKDNQFYRDPIRTQIFEIKDGRAKFNIMNSDNPVVSVDIDVLDCREQ